MNWFDKISEFFKKYPIFYTTIILFILIIQKVYKIIEVDKEIDTFITIFILVCFLFVMWDLFSKLRLIWMDTSKDSLWVKKSKLEAKREIEKREFEIEKQRKEIKKEKRKISTDSSRRNENYRYASSVVYYLSYILLLIIIFSWVILNTKTNYLLGEYQALMAEFILFFVTNFRIVKSNPTHVAILVVFGVKTKTVVRQGFHLFPRFIIGLIETSMEPIVENNIEVEGVDCKNIRKVEKSDEQEKDEEIDTSVKMKFILKLLVDNSPEGLITFIDHGGKEKILKLIIGKIRSTVRTLSVDKTWQHLVASREWITAMVITEMTSKKPRRLKSGINAADVPDQYNRYFEKDDEYYEDIPVEDYEKHPKEIKHFLAKALTNGVSTVEYMGVKVLELTLEEVIPDPEIKKEAQNIAKEELQKKQRDIQTNTVKNQAEIHFNFLMQGLSDQEFNPDQILKLRNACFIEAKNSDLIHENKSGIIRIDPGGVENSLTQAALATIIKEKGGK